MELEVWRRVGEGWRVGAAKNKQNWRAGEGLGRPRSEGWRASPGAGAGWVAPKSESCELDANSLKSAKSWPNGSGKGLGSLMTKRRGLEPRPVIWRFARIRRTSEASFADLRELASNSHEFPCPVPCPALPDLSELASNSQDSAPAPAPVFARASVLRFERISVKFARFTFASPATTCPCPCPWPPLAPAPGPVFCDLSELASNSQDSHLPLPLTPAPGPVFCDLSELASNSQDSHLPRPRPPAPCPAVFCGFERISV